MRAVCGDKRGAWTCQKEPHAAGDHGAYDSRMGVLADWSAGCSGFTPLHYLTPAEIDAAVSLEKRAAESAKERR